MCPFRVALVCAVPELLSVVAGWPEERELVLRNRQTLVRFVEANAGFALAELKCLHPHYDFVARGQLGAPLWRLKLRPPSCDGKSEVALDSTARCVGDWSQSQAAQVRQMRLSWRGLDLPEEPAALAVSVTVVLGAGTTFSEWRITVNNRSRRLGLWAVDFPLMPNLSVAQSGVLAVPLGWGTLQQDPVRNANYVANYPSLFSTLQVVSLSDQGACLYVSTHDPDGYVKQVNWAAHSDKGRLEYFLRNYPEDMGRPGKSYSSPYPVVIGCLPGDWYDAAKRYRQWVIAKAPWAPKVPLEQYSGSPRWIKENALWLQSNGRGTTEPTDSLLNCLDIRGAMPGVPSANQLYWWQPEWPNQAQFDEGYPDTFFSLGRGEVEVKALRRLREAGLRLVPYTNPNLVDARTRYWKEGGWRWAALPAEQSPRREAWIADLNTQAAENKPVNVTMCPYPSARHDVVVAWARNIVGEFGFDGVYLDQVGCMDATLCFDPSHGHPLGGGKHWVQGYRRMLARVQQAIRQVNPEAILTTESACEPFGYFDAYLRCNEDQGWMTPIWSAVYGGLCTSYGSYLYSEDKLGGCLYAAKFAQLFTYGAQLGWLSVGPHVADPSPWLEYLHELAKARTAAARWIGMGEYLRPPELTGVENVTGRWRLFAAEYDVTWPAVLSAAFKAANGTVALAFTNYSDKTQQFRWTVRRDDLRLPPAQYETRSLYLRADAPQPLSVQDNEQLEGNLTMQPLTATVLLISPRRKGAR